MNLECFQLFSAKNTYVSLIDIIFPRRRFDSHLPAAAAARAAWSTAFPPHKQAGALTHCQTEILELVSNNWFCTPHVFFTVITRLCTPVLYSNIRLCTPLLYCAAQVTENLIIATPQTLSDPATTPTEEMEAGVNIYLEICTSIYFTSIRKFPGLIGWLFGWSNEYLFLAKYSPLYGG